MLQIIRVNYCLNITMVHLLWFIFICQAIAAQCFLQPPYVAPAGFLERSVTGDVGKKLFLTPYISSGQVTEGRRAARVQLPGPALESYAGFFTVDDAHHSNQFLWYFPPVSEAAATAPVLVWLQGLGMSSLFGLFIENGPLQVINGSFTRREHHWALNHHVIYIDNPVGTGFSFADSEEGYCRNQTQVGEQLYSTLTQFFQLFPELLPNKFFVTGESYAGKFVPALAYTIHKKNPTAKAKINLQGLVIGNGWCDPEHQLVHSEYMFQLGIINSYTKKIIESFEAQAIQKIRDQDWLSALEYFFNIIKKIRVNAYNYSPDGGSFLSYKKHMAEVASMAALRKAIHVGDQVFVFDNKTTLKEDIMQSVAPWISELLNDYSIVFYSGQYDVIVPYPSTEKFLRNLNFNGSKEYAESKRKEWTVGGELAGWCKLGGRLTEVLVRGAGHMVPADQPAWAHDLITTATHCGF